jgi:arabinan endo-1,5-alpha-L-arabinosidase
MTEKRKRQLLSVMCIIGGFILTGCGQQTKLKASEPVEKSFEEVSVHDPSVLEGEDGEYYIFGSHLAVAKTNDFMNWTYVNQGVKNDNTVIPNVVNNMKEAFEWSHSNTFWAPDVVQLNNGSYVMYYCNCKGDEPLSCLGMAVSDSIQGPYTNKGLILKSGMGADLMDEDGNLYQATTDPNVVDPDVFYDEEGRLWMLYGSYSGGIFIKEMNPETGEPLDSGYGKKLLGGNHLRIEGPYIIYNPETEYYYMYLSFGGLDSDGGYNIRVCRSKNPDGPYVDSMGQEMTDCKGPSGSYFSDVTAMQYGTKLMGNYKFLWEEGEEGEERNGYLSPGHNSCIYREETNQYFIIYHTRMENNGEDHEVRVHQMFFNEDGWPVIAPYRYAEEKITPCSKDAVSTAYKFINHGREISADINESVDIELKSNGSITGAIEGSWELSGDYDITLTIDKDVYKGVFLKQWDEDGKKYVMTFTALCSETGVSVWGSGLDAIEE